MKWMRVKWELDLARFRLMMINMMMINMMMMNLEDPHLSPSLAQILRHHAPIGLGAVLPMVSASDRKCRSFIVVSTIAGR